MALKRKPQSKPSTPTPHFEPIPEAFEPTPNEQSEETTVTSSPIVRKNTVEEVDPHALVSFEVDSPATASALDTNSEGDGAAPVIVWNRMPSDDPACLGTGYFPFDRTTDTDPPQYSVHDLELRGKVDLCGLKANPKWSHYIDVRLLAEDIVRIKDFVRTSGRVPINESCFKWSFQNGARSIRFTGKHDITHEFDQVWDARDRTEVELYDIEARRIIPATEVVRNCTVMVEAIPEVWQRQDDTGLLNKQGCTMHLVAIGVMEDGPPPPAERDVMQNYHFTSPKSKRRCVNPFDLKKEGA
jgi:hypothetical protein